MFGKVKKLLKGNNEKKKGKKSRSTQAPTDDELFVDPKRFVLTPRFRMLWEYLMKHAPEADGIFRVPGSQPRIRALKILLDSENNPDLETYDVHVVGGVFKQYLREQKEPLLTHDLYEGFIAAHGIEDEQKKTETVKGLLNNLPLGFLTALRALVELLYKIDRNSAVNLMSMTNLAIVFSPTLLRARDETVAKIMQDSTAAHGIVLFLLTRPELLTFFGVKITEKNSVAVADLDGQPRSDPSLGEKKIDREQRSSRLLAASSPNFNHIIMPSSSPPVLLQVNEGPRGRMSRRSSVTSTASDSPTRVGSPARRSGVKLSGDYLSKGTQDILAALDMIIEGKDISSSDDDVAAARTDSNTQGNSNNTNNNANNITSSSFTVEEFDVEKIVRPLKPANGEKIEHLDSESEDSEVDSSEEEKKVQPIAAPKKANATAPIPIARPSQPKQQAAATMIGGNRAPQPERKLELFEQPLARSPRAKSPRKDSNSSSLAASPKKETTAIEEPKKETTTEPKKESPRSPRDIVKAVSPPQSPRKEPVQPVKQPTPPLSPRTVEVATERLPTPRKVVSPPLSPRQVEEPVKAVEPVQPVKQPTPPLSPRKVEIAPEVVPVHRPVEDVKPVEPVKQATPPPSPRKGEHVIENTPNAASEPHTPQKVNEPTIVASPKTPRVVTPRQMPAVPKTGVPKQSPKQIVASPRKIAIVRNPTTGEPVKGPDSARDGPASPKIILPDARVAQVPTNADYKLEAGHTPVALSPKTPVALVKMTPLIVSPRTPPAGKGGQGPLASPKTPHTPTGRALPSPKKASAVLVSPRTPNELTRTVSASTLSKPTTPILTPDVDAKRTSPRSMTTEDVQRKEKEKNDKLKRQHTVDQLLSDLDLIEQFTCRMYQDMEIYNKDQIGFVVEMFKDISKFLTAALKDEKTMITPADISKFTSGSNARFISNADQGMIAIRDQFKVIMALSGDIKEKLFAPASLHSDKYFDNLSFMFDQITEFLEKVVAELSEGEDEDDARDQGIDPQLLQLKNAMDEIVQKIEKEINAKFSERINKAASLYSTPHLTILFDSLVWIKKKMNGFSPPIPDDQLIQQVLRISQASMTGNHSSDAVSKAHSLIASCKAELKDLTEFQLQKLQTEAANALNNFDASIARYRIINSIKILNQISQFVSKFKQLPPQMTDAVVRSPNQDELDQLAKETVQSIDRLKLIGTVIKKQLLNINGLEQAIFVSKIIKTIKSSVMSVTDSEPDGQELIDFAKSYDRLSDELRAIVMRGLPATEAEPEDVPKVKSLLVGGGVIMDEFVGSLPKLKENVAMLKSKPFPHTYLEYASQRVKLIYKLLELIVQVNKSYDGPLTTAPRALSMPTVLSPPGSPSLLPTSPRAQPTSPRSGSVAGTSTSQGSPGLMRSNSMPVTDQGAIDERTVQCRQLLNQVLTKINSVTDINFIVALGQVGKTVKKLLSDAIKKQPVSFMTLSLNLTPSEETLSAEHLEKMNSLKHLIINLLKDVDKELSQLSAAGLNNTMSLSLLSYIQQLLLKFN